MRRRVLRVAVFAAAAALTVAACASQPGATAPPVTTGPPTAALGPTAPPVTAPLGTPVSLPTAQSSVAPASPAQPAASVPRPIPSIPAGSAVSRDPSLLALLPATVGGATVTEEAASFAEAAHDPAFVASVDRAVFAIAVSGGDLASGVVAHLRPGVYSEAMFADWRATYDDGACSQSGGVVAHAESALSGRSVFITTCGGGLRVYHVYLPGAGVLVSLFSVGSGDFGAQLIGALRG